MVAGVFANLFALGYRLYLCRHSSIANRNIWDRIIMLRKIIIASAWTFTLLCFIACIVFGLIACLSNSTRDFGGACALMGVVSAISFVTSGYLLLIILALE
jgi:hypothetical protein